MSVKNVHMNASIYPVYIQSYSAGCFFIFFAFFSVVSFIRVCCLFSFYNCCCFFDIITTSPCLVSRITTDDDDDDDDGVCVRLHKMNKMRNKQRKTVQSDLTPMMVLYVILAAHMSSRL